MIKVLDFGLAKAFAEDAPDSSLSQSPTISLAATQQGMILGTAAYMSPEQARGLEVDKRTDVWAFGCVLYEMLTGEQIFAAEDVSLTLAGVMKGEPDWSKLPSEMPSPLRTLMERCLEKDQKKRLRDIGEARIVLSGPMADESVRAASGPGPGRGRPWAWIAVSTLLLIGLISALLVNPTGTPDRRTLRYPIPLPAGLTFDQGLSPDGQYLAIAAVLDDNTHVFVRRLDSTEFRRLEDTADAQNPFWSPNSQRIGFFGANNKLKTVDVNGGPSEEVTDVPGLLDKSGAWGVGNVIVIAPSNKFAPGPLLRVQASGGTPTPLTIAETGEGHLWPAFLPDGRHFVYTSQGGSAPGIYIASLDDPAGKRILPDTSNALVTAPSGPEGDTYVLFVRDGGLWVQTLDLTALALTGDATQLLDQVPLRDDQAAYVSASNDGTLAYFDGSYRETDSRYSWFDADGAHLSDEGGLGPAATTSLSPDEQTLVVSRRIPPNRFKDLTRRDVSQDSETPLTFNATVEGVSNAVWSPDSRHIVYTGSTFDLMMKDTRSADPGVVLFDSDEPVYPTDWSGDGRYLLYTKLENGANADIWYVELEPSADDGYTTVGEPQPFLDTPFLESSGRLSPGGQWIAYTFRDTGAPAVYVRPFPSGDGAERVSPPGPAFQPQWSADGNQLYYAGGNPGQLRLFGMDVTRRVPASPESDARFETTPPELLFNVGLNSFHPAWGSIFYSVADNGERFLINHFETTEPPVINIVTNWQQAFGLEE
jgi:Tol biopolymer transport system component